MAPGAGCLIHAADTKTCPGPGAGCVLKAVLLRWGAT